jgi:hypothetical protein
MAYNSDKDNVFEFLKKLNQDIVVVISEMKQDFEKNPATTNIKERLMVKLI